MTSDSSELNYCPITITVFHCGSFIAHTHCDLCRHHVTLPCPAARYLLSAVCMILVRSHSDWLFHDIKNHFRLNNHSWRPTNIVGTIDIMWLILCLLIFLKPNWNWRRTHLEVGGVCACLLNVRNGLTGELIGCWVLGALCMLLWAGSSTG